MLSGTLCALVLSGKAVWLRIEEWKMHWPNLFFSGFLSTIFLTFLSYFLFLMQQVVKCDGSVYDVDDANTIENGTLQNKCVIQKNYTEWYSRKYESYKKIENGTVQNKSVIQKAI